MHNENNADAMHIWSTCAANPNYIMSGMHESCAHTSQTFLANIHELHFTYWAGMHPCQPLTVKINCLTFSGYNYPKYKWKHAQDGSHCTA